VTSSTSPKAEELWTLRALFARHKLAAATTAAAIVVLLTTILIAAFGSTGGPVTDATTCSEWGSSNQDQQTAYARLYVREHPPPPGVATSPASIIGAINNGCNRAYTDDVSDTTTVVQALRGDF
jgi:hypothetical protein